jgi:hypothetical protein
MTETKLTWKDNTAFLIGVVLFICAVIWAVVDGLNKDKVVVVDDTPLEKMNERLDCLITERNKKIDAILAKIDTLNLKDATTVREKTKVYNYYYNENNRINLLDDSSQFGLLSKNLAKGTERERSGYYDVPNR